MAASANFDELIDKMQSMISKIIKIDIEGRKDPYPLTQREKGLIANAEELIEKYELMTGAIQFKEALDSDRSVLVQRIDDWLANHPSFKRALKIAKKSIPVINTIIGDMSGLITLFP